MQLIEFKYPELEAEFEKLDWRLKIQIYALAGYLFHKFSKNIVLVSLIREEDMTSVHYWLCGADFRIAQNGQDPKYTDPEIKAMKQFTSHFEYDKDRPRKKALFVHPNRSKSGGKGSHGHFQVNPNSVITGIKK